MSLKRLNLSPAEYLQFAKRADELGMKTGINSEADLRALPLGFLCEADGYGIYLDQEAPQPNPDWDVAQDILAVRGRESRPA